MEKMKIESGWVHGKTGRETGITSDATGASDEGVFPECWLNTEKICRVENE